MSALLLALLLDLNAAPSCIARDGQLACGFHCTSNLTQLACARTPEGLCTATPDHVVCWDPPPDVRWLLQTRDDITLPRCISSTSQAACGFACVQSGSRVACANTPMGACGSRFGELRCFDPAPEVRWAMEADDDLRPAECERTLSKVVCGYHCESTLDDVRCAATPWGSCVRHFDSLACWDPAPSLQAASALDTR
jgi:hypothetical protein